MNGIPKSPGRITQWLERTSKTNFAAYTIVAAFTTYFCMYAFRKPFTAGEFVGVTFAGIAFKTVLVTSQVTGYMISKFIGIKVVSEMPAERRAVGILGLIGIAEVTLVLFGLVSAPWNFVFLFLNGLPLGMVFGLVLGFLEGRRVTETLTAGLCASFIVASGAVKSVGRSLVVDYGVSEFWMPALTGLLFVVPLVIGVFMLSQIPAPTDDDVTERTHRSPMDADQRRALYRKHFAGLSGLLLIYILLTVIRSIRDDFAVEIWKNLGHDGEPEIYATSETYVMLGVLLINGFAATIRNNRKAFLSSLVLTLAGFLVVLFSIGGYRSGVLAPFPFMVLLGWGAYVPYVAFHTTVFERLIAAFRDRGNLGYLMYLADAVGYLGYVAVMVVKTWLPKDLNFLDLFVGTTFWLSIVATLVSLGLLGHYLRTVPHSVASDVAAQPASEMA